jgi:hypothetical protein
MGAEITNDQVQADRYTDWDGDDKSLNSVSESSSESEEDENTRHEQWRASTRRKRLTASDIISDESDIHRGDSSDSDDDSTNGSDSSSSSGAGAGISSDTRKIKGGATKNEQEKQKGRQKRYCQGKHRKKKETQDETELEEQTRAQEPQREPLDRTAKTNKKDAVQKKSEHRRGRK